jgi:hypothetical protein
MMPKNFPTDPNSLGNLVMQVALAEAQKKTHSMRCPEHNQPATLTIKGPGQISIVGCCEAFRNSVKQAMAR